jgi:predicted nucleotidyltransferase
MDDLRPYVAAWKARAERERERGRALLAERRARLSQVVAYLRDEVGATEIVLFGSPVTGEGDAASDVDLAVRGIPAARYFEALARVSDLLGCDVDLVELESARPSLARCIEDTGEVLHDG